MKFIFLVLVMLLVRNQAQANEGRIQVGPAVGIRFPGVEVGSIGGLISGEMNLPATALWLGLETGYLFNSESSYRVAEGQTTKTGGFSIKVVPIELTTRYLWDTHELFKPYLGVVGGVAILSVSADDGSSDSAATGVLMARGGFIYSSFFIEGRYGTAFNHSCGLGLVGLSFEL